LFLFDYSAFRKKMSLLSELADEVKLKEAITACFEGDVINQAGEGRPVLHTALLGEKRRHSKGRWCKCSPSYEVKQNIKIASRMPQCMKILVLFYGTCNTDVAI
jgi:glucose-6-phosphate isomerase